RSGRQFAAWLGLTPKDHSTAGKTRLGVITRAGDETLRSLLVVGATAVIWQARRGKSRSASPWLLALLQRKPPQLPALPPRTRTTAPPVPPGSGGRLVKPTAPTAPWRQPLSEGVIRP